MSAVMIDAKNVTRNFSISRGMFRGKQILRAVSGVDLTVKKGEVLALVGESGCGKTTLAKIILGLLPQTTSGLTDQCQHLPFLDRQINTTYRPHDTAYFPRPIFFFEPTKDDWVNHRVADACPRC